jgi:hypothetical protein
MLHGNKSIIKHKVRRLNFGFLRLDFEDSYGEKNCFAVHSLILDITTFLMASETCDTLQKSKVWS